MTFLVVNTDGYDVLLGLDFLMKIRAVVDVEQGLIQVKHGPGTNVEVLPLTMVNLLQRMSLGYITISRNYFIKFVRKFVGFKMQK
jgi:hypothetical protein